MRAVYGLDNEDAMNQSRGACSTPGGRCLAWPNTLQHQVQPFRLADPTQPGHRKILCFFVVDPHRRIPSTAECPPQQTEWLVRELKAEPSLRRLPDDVFDCVCAFLVGMPGGPQDPEEDDEEDDVMDDSSEEEQDVPRSALMTRQDAELCRKLLMAERMATGVDWEGQFFEREFSLCEH